MYAFRAILTRASRAIFRSVTASSTLGGARRPLRITCTTNPRPVAAGFVPGTFEGRQARYKAGGPL
jgi:hypothetical protein